MVRLIVFNIDTSSCKIGWSLPYHFKTQLHTNGIIAPITTHSASYLVTIVYPIIFGDLFMTLYSI